MEIGSFGTIRESYFLIALTLFSCTAEWLLLVFSPLFRFLADVSRWFLNCLEFVTQQTTKPNMMQKIDPTSKLRVIPSGYQTRRYDEPKLTAHVLRA